ncbi:MAG: hypothetical protein WC683_09850 [bacterium]
MKKIIVLSIICLLVALPASAATVTSVLSHDVRDGFGRVTVYADTLLAAGTVANSQAIKLVDPAWITLAGGTNYISLPLSIVVKTTFAVCDTFHVGVQTSEDGSTWYTALAYTLQTSSMTEGTPEVVWLTLPAARYIRVQQNVKTTATGHCYTYITYPVK